MNKRNREMYLSGWAMREFSLDDISNYLLNYSPKYFEISKDLCDGEVSIKGLKNLLLSHSVKNKDLEVYYAGTTDFCDCSGLDFNSYLEYLGIQHSQARFLSSKFFRIMIGGNIDFSPKKILKRINSFSKMIKPMKACVEIHGGWESSIDNIKILLTKTNVVFVLDSQNILESGLDLNILENLIPSERIAYFHVRNYGDYIEHDKSSGMQNIWINNNDHPIFWEPKKIFKKDILNKYYEY